MLRDLQACALVVASIRVARGAATMAPDEVLRVSFKVAPDFGLGGLESGPAGRRSCPVSFRVAHAVLTWGKCDLVAVLGRAKPEAPPVHVFTRPLLSHAPVFLFFYCNL